MATDILKKAGEYNLEQVELISYRNHGEEGGVITMDIKQITIQEE